MMTSCSWVKDDIDDCPFGFWLKLHYTYNILDVDAAPKYVTDAHVYVYDAEGNYIKRIIVTQDMLISNNYRVRVEGLEEGDYQFVVWSGMGSNLYSVSGDTQSIGDFRLSIADVTAPCDYQLPSLFYGYLPAVHYDDSYAEYSVGLMKNTNQLACLVVSVDNQLTLSPTDYSMKIVASNGVMNALNLPVATMKTTYEPYVNESVSINDPDYGTLNGIKFGLSTLRLMDSKDCRIIFERKSTGQHLFDISLSEYMGMIGSLYTNSGRVLPVQEYLDRQDFYTVIFFLSGDVGMLMQLQVNNWRLRAYNHLKL